jgi:hypothetical protein
MMDTKTLVVGQYVQLGSGIYDGGAGKVIRVTPWGVEVQTTSKGLLCFDSRGHLCNSQGETYSNAPWSTDPWAWEHINTLGTYECGTWELIPDDLDNIAKARLERLHREIAERSS